jgi:hypothetical protein
MDMLRKRVRCIVAVLVAMQQGQVRATLRRAHPLQKKHTGRPAWRHKFGPAWAECSAETASRFGRNRTRHHTIVSMAHYLARRAIPCVLSAFGQPLSALKLGDSPANLLINQGVMATLQERRLGYHSRAGLEPGTSRFSTLRINHYAARGITARITPRQL